MVDKHMSMSVHVGKIGSKAFGGLYKIRQIKKFYLWIHAFASSHVDYCNALLTGTPQYQLSSPTNSESFHCCCQINSPLSKISTHHSSIDCTSLVTSKISDGIQNCFIGLQGSQQHDSNLHF